MGLQLVPPGGWPLDRLFVGVGTLRTMRELFLLSRKPGTEPLRAWDLSLRSRVTPQGSADCVDRLEESGLITIVTPGYRGHSKEFVLDRNHPLATPVIALFDAERFLVRRNSALP